VRKLFPRIVRLGMAVWLLIGGLASNAMSIEITPSALAISPSVIDPKTEILKAKYGSRFMCEAKREQTIQIYSTLGVVLGTLGAVAIGSSKKSDGGGNPATSNILLIGSTLVGLAGGWGLGSLLAPDCTPLPWTEKSQESWKQWKSAEKNWKDCKAKHDETVTMWSVGGILVGMIGGSLIAAKAMGTGGEEGAILPVLLGSLLGAALGGLVGSFIGEKKALKCDSQPPTPELFMPIEQAPIDVPAPAPIVR